MAYTIDVQGQERILVSVFCWNKES